MGERREIQILNSEADDDWPVLSSLHLTIVRLRKRTYSCVGLIA
jgi:hypothetical protein